MSVIVELLLGIRWLSVRSVVSGNTQGRCDVSGVCQRVGHAQITLFKCMTSMRTFTVFTR